MQTKVVTASATGTAEAAAETLVRELRAGLAGQEPVLVMTFASMTQPLGRVAPVLAAAFPTARVLGASTAGEFTERGDTKGAVCAVAIAGDFKVFAGMATGVKAAPEAAVSAAIRELPRTLAGYPHRVGLLLLDTFAGNCEEVTLLCAAELGIDQPLAGGAAGDDLQMKSTFVSSGGHAKDDALVVAQIFSKTPLGIGVSHGHSPLSAPLRVTSASGNVVREIEGRPAWSAWLDATRTTAKADGIDVDAMKDSDEGAFLLRYEAGLSLGDGYKIRAPLSRAADGSISFACGIPEGAVLRIMRGTASGQIDSAVKAASLARAGLTGAAAGAIVFDCICRNLILKDEFASAVRGVSAELGGVPIAGFETYGEIALHVGEMSGFHNTTTVVLATPA